MKKKLFAGLIAGMMSVIVAGSALAAPPADIPGKPDDVGGKPAMTAFCHFDEEAGVHYLINIPDPAVEALLANHEDDYIYDEDSGMTCEPAPDDEDEEDDSEDEEGEGDEVEIV